MAEYFRGLIQRGLCQGTIRPTRYALQFIFQNTLRRDWGLFKKESPPRVAGVCPRLPPTPSAAARSPPYPGRCVASVWP